jgi:hypothetical protein
MLYETLVEEEFEQAVADSDQETADDGTVETGSMAFVPLLAIAEADEFSATVGRLEEAGIPWYVESDGDAVVLFVTESHFELAHQLTI